MKTNWSTDSAYILLLWRIHMHRHLLHKPEICVQHLLCEMLSLGFKENKCKLHPGGGNSGTYRMTDSTGFPFNHGGSNRAGGHLQFGMFFFFFFFFPPSRFDESFLDWTFAARLRSVAVRAGRSLIWKMFVFFFSLLFCEIVLGTQPPAICQYIPYVDAKNQKDARLTTARLIAVCVVA